MTIDEISLPFGFPLAEAARMIEEAATGDGLRIALRGTNTDYPGSILWHWKRGKEAGTLKATLIQGRSRRILLTVDENRPVPWAEPALDRISDALRARLAPGKDGEEKDEG